ncbi:MAG: restriction endonuclease subunit S [Bacteroidales bacterium]|nr:restriction endonuclease subunit S [Bacteroidales bacterium]
MVMSKYRFEQIVFNSTEKKKPIEEDKYTYLGLEHLDSGSLHVTRYGSDVAPIGEKLIMKEGDVLFGKRRAYQKKVAVAPFDGIFSAHGMVLRPKEEVIDKDFFPLFISSDYFLDAAIKISVGSLSPTINWRDLKELEFELPDLDKQRKLAKVLWAIDATKKSYQKLLLKTDELMKSQFMEQFGEKAVKHHGWKVTPIDKVVEKPMSGEWGKDDFEGTGVKVLRTTNFTDRGVIDYSDVVTRKIDDKKANQKYMKFGDILIEKSGGSDTKPVGRVVFYDGKDDMFLSNNFTSILRLKPEVGLLSVYLFEFLFVNYWSGGTRIYENKTTGIHNLKLADYLAGTSIPLPPMEIQEQFAAFARQSDKSKSELEQALVELTATYKKIISENLG